MKSDLSSTSTLPPEPFVKIRPYKSWSMKDFRELVTRRELLFFLIWRDLKVRYRQTLLGSLWIILQPLSMTAIFTIFFGLLGHSPADNLPYPAFVYSGLVTWTFLSNAVLSSCYSFVSNVSLVNKVYFPRTYIPTATVAVRLFDYLIAAGIMFGLNLYYGFTPTWRLFLFPVLILQTALLALGVGMMTAALNVKYRDIGTILPVIIQIWMFMSPVVYSSSIVPDRWSLFYMLNPLTGILENQRAALFGLDFNPMSFLVSGIVVVLILFFSILFFRQAEASLTDVI